MQMRPFMMRGSKLIFAIGEIFHIFYITVLWLVSPTVLKQDLEQFVLLMSIFMHKLVSWTGTGKTDKIKMREDILAAIEDHRIDLSKIKNQTTMQYLSGFKRYSTERVMKSLVGEFTQNEKWSVKGQLMGECWYNDCCVSEHPDIAVIIISWSYICFVTPGKFIPPILLFIFFQ